MTQASYPACFIAVGGFEMKPPMSVVRRKLVELHGRGFDSSELRKDGSIKLKCSNCEATAINGIACHEQGCPNSRSQNDEEE